MKKLHQLFHAFINHSISEQFLWLRSNKYVLFQTLLVESGICLAKSKACVQITALAFSRASEFATPERARTKFKNDMVEEPGQLDVE